MSAMEFCAVIAGPLDPQRGLGIPLDEVLDFLLGGGPCRGLHDHTGGVRGRDGLVAFSELHGDLPTGVMDLLDYFASIHVAGVGQFLVSGDVLVTVQSELPYHILALGILDLGILHDDHASPPLAILA